MAQQAGRPLSETVTHVTNLYRRCGFGRLDGGSIAPAWGTYTATLQSLETHAQRVAWTQAFFAQSPPEPPPSREQQFGCFTYDPPDGKGIVRIHFMNRDTDDIGPLSRSKIETRKHELKEMFTRVRLMHADAKQVRGASWLYHTEAYRRLFPAVYGDSRAILEGRAQFQGSSSWGQFLDNREGVKPAIREQFLQNLASLNLDRLWEVFPLPTYTTRAPIRAFYDAYGIR
ncbi:MAG: hypothetical protein AB7R89_20940 [Dehalococcoidia bacterium]